MLRATLSIVFGFVILLIAAWQSGSTGEICEATKTAQEHCDSYNLAPFLIIKVFKIFHALEGVVTALATAAIAWFTWTIWQVNKSQLIHGHKVERAYVSGGGAPEVQQFDLGTLTTGMGRGLAGSSTTRHRVFKKHTGKFMVCVNNYGKTPGRLEWVGFGFCDARNIPAEPIYERRYFYDWVQPGVRDRPIFPIPIPKDRPETAVYGRFYYWDIFGGLHSCGFINEIGPKGESVPILAPAAYTEERDED
jgi:hypothetical protein